MSEVAVRVENLSKRYRIGSKEEIPDTLAQAVGNLARGPIRRLRRLRRLARFDDRDGSQDVIWAVKDVSFDVNRNDVVGIIGPNGAGKSTLLKMVSRITEPTSGRIETYGRVSSLLEVGTGFHPELTGRENIFLNGAVLGMTRAEIKRKFDEIVDFSGVEKFIDTPVKRYSTGMKVRLAFSVAAHLDPEILLIDEVLAVGDAEFQRKCLGKMSVIAQQGRTVLFVSHNMGAVQRLCSERVIWLRNGGIEADGDGKTVVSQYLDAADPGYVQNGVHAQGGSRGLSLQSVVTKDETGGETTSFKVGSDIAIEMRYYASRRIDRPNFWVTVAGQFGPLFAARMQYDDLCPEYIEGAGAISCVFRDARLLPQTYSVSVGVRDETVANASALVPAIEGAAGFRVLGDAADLGMPGVHADTLLEAAPPVLVPYEWHYEDGRVAAPRWAGLADERSKTPDGTQG